MKKYLIIVFLLVTNLSAWGAFLTEAEPPSSMGSRCKSALKAIIPTSATGAIAYSPLGAEILEKGIKGATNILSSPHSKLLFSSAVGGLAGLTAMAGFDFLANHLITRKFSDLEENKSSLVRGGIIGALSTALVGVYYPPATISLLINNGILSGIGSVVCAISSAASAVLITDKLEEIMEKNLPNWAPAVASLVGVAIGGPALTTLYTYGGQNATIAAITGLGILGLGLAYKAVEKNLY